MLRKWEPITPLSREGNKGDATASERYSFPMRTSAPTQPFQTEPSSNSNSEIRNQQMPCSAAAADESAAKHLFKLSRDVILSLDRIGKILCINHRGVELSGYSESELRGANIFELLLVPEDREFAREMLADLLKGETREYQVRWRTKDDGIVHFDGASVPRLSESGEFLSTLCTLRDITQRKSAEERLRKSEEKYRDLIEISPDAIYVVDAQGICVLGNRAGVELAGIPQDELVGTPVTDTYLPDERHLFQERLEQLKAQRTVRFERKFMRKNGEIIPVEVSVSGIRGGYFQAILRDISERKRAEEALRESEERYRVLVEVSPNSICVHRDGKLLYVNPAGVRLFGAKDLVDLVGRSVLDFIHPDSLPIVRERMRQLRAGETVPLIEERFVTLNGEVRDVEVTAIPIIYERAPAAQVMFRDITERKQAEEKLRASEQVARGQVEALTYSLDVLATAPAPDKFIGQMLSTIGRLLKAQSVILWLLDEANDSLVLRAAAQGTNFEAADPAHPFIRNPLLWKEDKVLQETVFTGAPVICEDVEDDPRVSSAIREYFKSKGTKKYLTIPTLVGGRVKGFIGIRHEARPRYRPEEIELAQALAHQAMLAIQLNEFAEQSRQAAILEERNRMARDIHDTLAQGFTGVIVQLEAVEDAIACCRRKEANEHLRRASELARQSLNEARRSVHALRPQALQRGNFWEALKRIVKNTTAGTALHTTFELRGKLHELPPGWQENLLHIGQEALTNALKYAHPRNFETRLICNTKELRLELRDDGGGFKINGRHDGLGLAGMRERAEQMGGTLKVASARGKGTTIVVTVPYPPRDGFAVANNHESRPRRNDGFQAVGTVPV